MTSNIHSLNLLLAMYIYPCQSYFFSNDLYNDVRSEVTDISSKYDCLFLCGDFIAQTSNLQDFVWVDDYFSELFDFEYETGFSLNDECILKQKAIQINRNLADNKKNSHGYKLIDVCKSTNLFIGHLTIGDIPGKKTFKDSSVINKII